MMKTKKRKRVKHSMDIEKDMKGQETLEEGLETEMDGKDTIVTRDQDPKGDIKTTKTTTEIGGEMTEIGEETTV